MIELHNTLGNKNEEFKPIEPGVVSMYHCGPTVYNYAHIGNLRSYVFADLIRRFFEYENFQVRQVINITDVGHLVSDADVGDDKMIIGAKREEKTVGEVAKMYTDAFLNDLKLLNIETTNTIFPKATEHIQEQIDLIEKLVDKGFTYKTTDGIYFDTSKFPDYGKLGNINLKGLEEGSRIGLNSEKKNHSDFALWKFSPTDGEKREQEWPSPWGIGFPGWHIECSAMSMKYLGETFDIHTGGIDHIPTHHQNEIAQSESATGKKFVDYWLHHEHLRINNEKISKSLGNQILLKEIIEKGFSPLAYRYFLLLSNYRTPANFTWEGLQAAQNAHSKLRSLMPALIQQSTNGTNSGQINTNYKEQFTKALENDLNTPEAVAVLWQLAKDESIEPAIKFNTIVDFDRVLGLKLYGGKIEFPAHISDLVAKRENYKKDKDFINADKVRQEIEEAGYSVQDTPNGPILSSK